MHDAVFVGHRKPQTPGPRGKQTLERRGFSSSSEMRGKDGREYLILVFLSREEAERGHSHCRILIYSIKHGGKAICRK